MSPDRTTITRAEALRRKREEKERLEKEANSSSSQTAAHKSVISRTISQIKNPAVNAEETWKPNRRVSKPEPNRKPFKLNLPHIPFPRIDFSSISVALIIAALTIGLTYVALYTSVFAVQSVDISGTKLVDPYSIINGLDVMDQPLLTLDRHQVRVNILATYPEIKDVTVTPTFPNKLKINVIERIPIAEWHQDGTVLWVDNDGFAFEPKSQNSTLTIVEALSPAPGPGSPSENSYGATPFIFPQLASAVQTVSRMLPQGTVITYTPDDGLSWTDPIGGWQVLYGKTDGNNDEKMAVYQALVDHLTSQGIVPSLISVEYPSNPTYETNDEE